MHISLPLHDVKVPYTRHFSFRIMGLEKLAAHSESAAVNWSTKYGHCVSRQQEHILFNIKLHQVSDNKLLNRFKNIGIT